MSIFTTAGTKLFIGTAIKNKNSDFVLSDFASQTWTEINGLENIGSLGDTSEEVTFGVIGNMRVQKYKGLRNAGNMEIIIGVDYSDAGQKAIRAAERTIYDYAFRIVFNDAPVDGTPSERLFIAKVMSASEEAGEANNVVKLKATLGINSNIVVVDAADSNEA
ncbi:hypothetical protein H3S80_01715 [Bartonella sp. M0177]|uniref:hypothetical protein n=1 Tax=Bartonella sp. M0177 TaxID=2750940 RepID=UPI0018DC153F|nr:hypothetical protein [Bartonella sp. M0177]MBI0002769.1 hypothetical protein [Bartonella sp. M0177]